MTRFLTFSLLLILLPLSSACRTLTGDQKAVKARLEEWNKTVELATNYDEGSTINDEYTRKAVQWAKDIRKEDSSAVRASIINSLPKLKRADRDIVKKLVLEILKSDPHEIVRLECVEALSSIRGEDALIAFTEVLTKRAPTGLLVENSPEVRAIAARGLGEIGSTKGAIALLIGLKDPVDWVRHQAENSLYRLIGDSKGRSFEEWRRWVEQLAKNAELEKEAAKRKKQNP
jgi:hypothetical protein